MKIVLSFFLLLIGVFVFDSSPAIAQSSDCSNITFSSFAFDPGSARLTPGVMVGISQLNNQMHANPSCRVVVMGNGNTTKAEQQLSWDRTNAVIEYMADVNNVDRNRFIFVYGQAGAANLVNCRAAADGEDGPSTVAPPHPDLRQR